MFLVFIEFKRLFFKRNGISRFFNSFLYPNQRIVIIGQGISSRIALFTFRRIYREYPSKSGEDVLSTVSHKTETSFRKRQKVGRILLLHFKGAESSGLA